MYVYDLSTLDRHIDQIASPYLPTSQQANQPDPPTPTQPGPVGNLAERGFALICVFFKNTRKIASANIIAFLHFL